MKFGYFTPETGSYKTVKYNLLFLNCCLLKSFLGEAVKQLTQIHMQGSQEPCADCITLPVSNIHMLYTSIIMSAQKSTTKRKKKEEAVKRMKCICRLSISL